MKGGGVLVELQRCKHPRATVNNARGFYPMATSGWTIEPIEGETKFVGVKVSGDKLADLDELAEQSGRTRSAIIRDAIEQYLDQEVAA